MSRTMKSPIVAMRKITSGAVLASSVLVGSAIGMNSAFAANPAATFPAQDVRSELSPSLLIAQAETTLLRYRTADYTVRVYKRGDQTLMNVFDNSQNLLRVNAKPATQSVLNGQAVYITNDSYSGRQAQYISEVLPNRFARLRIVDGSGSTIANQDATQVLEYNVPTDIIQRPQQDTILSFDTTTYAVRVFERNDLKFMNVYNKFTGETVVNGQPASLVPAEGPFANSVSYVSSGTQGGQSVRYVARISGSGVTTLEIYNVNNQRLFQEGGTGPVTVNIPSEDLPPGVEIQGVSDAYVAAVFGGDETLNQVKQLYPDAFMDSARQGDFINVGSFPNREAAQVRVLELRSQGFNSRLLYRDVTYR